MKSTGLTFAFLALTVIIARAGSLDDLTRLSESLSQLIGIDIQGIVDCFDESEASDLVGALNHLSNSLEGSNAYLSKIQYYEAVTLTTELQGSFECAIDTPAFKELVTSGETVSLQQISTAWNLWQGSGAASFSSLINDFVSNIDSGDFLTGAHDIYVVFAILSKELQNKYAVWDGFFGFVNGLLSGRGLYVSGDYKSCGYENNYDAVKFITFFEGLSALYDSDDLANAVNTYITEVGPIQFNSLTSEFVSCFFNSGDIKTLEGALQVKLDFSHAPFQKRLFNGFKYGSTSLHALNTLFNNDDYFLAGQLVSNLLG